MVGRLYLDFCGDELVLEPGGSLTFGRCADLVVDDNPYLHRRLGRFVDRGGVWCLEHTCALHPDRGARLERTARLDRRPRLSARHRPR